MAGEGLVSMTPSSIAVTGTSATINADGGVDFTSITELSLNGVFTSSYANYLISMNITSTAGAWVRMRLRSAGVDASGTDYISQTLKADVGTISGNRLTSLDKIYASVIDTTQNGLNLYVYGPALAQATAFRCIGAPSVSTAVIEEAASTHSLATAYDGITISPGTFTGTVHVFGYEE